MNVIDRFLPEGTFDNLHTYMTSPQIPWVFNKHKVSKDESTSSFQFVHTFYKVYMPDANKPFNKRDLSPLDGIIIRLKPYIVLSVKANMTPRTAEPDKTDYHTDLPTTLQHQKTAILYFNTNNGYTEFEGGETVESIANRLVVFDSSQRHRGVSCTDEKYRLVLNFNYIEYPQFLV